MKKYFIILLISISCFCKAQTSDSVLAEMIQLKIHGFEKIRHDALIKCKFRYARHIKKQIQAAKQELTQLTTTTNL